MVIKDTGAATGQKWIEVDGESLAPEKFESLDNAAARYLTAKFSISDARDKMESERSTICAIMHDEGLDTYDMEFDGRIYRLTRDFSEEVSIKKVKMPPGVE